MPIAIFHNVPGTLSIIEGGLRPVRLIFDMDDWDSIVLSAVITGARISRQTSHQLAVTLGGGIYVYVFGDAPGEFVINGIAAEAVCMGVPSRKTGFDRILEYYEKNKLSERAKPIRIVIGTTSLTALLRGITANYMSEFNLWEFQMAFIEIPKSSTLLSAPGAKGRRAAPAPAPGAPPPGGVVVAPPPFVPGDPGGAPAGGIALVPSPVLPAGFVSGKGAPTDLVWS
jgi:hypothetical protein